MFLQKRGAHLLGDRAVECGMDDGGLALAPSEQDDAAGLEDGAAAHGDGLGWDLVDATKRGCCVAAGDLIEENTTGA